MGLGVDRSFLAQQSSTGGRDVRPTQPKAELTTWKEEPAAATMLEEQCRRALGKGDHDTVLSLLMRTHGADLHRYCWRILREPVAEDVLQQTFLQAYEALPTLECRTTLRSWLYGIARHRCLDELDRRRRWARLIVNRNSADVAVPPVENDRSAELRALLPQLESCLGRLSPEARSTVLLRFQQDLSYEDIAATTGETPGALRVRVCRSLRVMRGHLEHQGWRTARLRVHRRHSRGRCAGPVA
jgi:RNA polymerase sigma factor (sigma-70 family)